MPVLFSTRLKNFNSVDLKRESHVLFDKAPALKDVIIPTSCPKLKNVSCFTDNFNRADSPFLGPAWKEWNLSPDTNHEVYSINTSNLRSFRACGPGNTNPLGPVGAQYLPFPDTTTDQSSRLIYQGFEILDTTFGPTMVGHGGVAVRMQQVGVGSKWEVNSRCYLLRYSEHRSTVAPFDVLFCRLALLQDGPGNDFLGIVPNPIAIPVLSIGDELKITAGNYTFTFGGVKFPKICLRGYINDVLKIQTNVPLGVPTPLMFTGGAGIGNDSYLSACGLALKWDNWQGCIMEPV